jgi:hypothetical protein
VSASASPKFLLWNKAEVPVLRKGNGRIVMDRCPHFGKRLMAIFGAHGRTELHCVGCDKTDPMKTEVGEWVESSLVPSLYRKSHE